MPPTGKVGGTAGGLQPAAKPDIIKPLVPGTTKTTIQDPGYLEYLEPTLDTTSHPDLGATGGGGGAGNGGATGESNGGALPGITDLENWPWFYWVGAAGVAFLAYKATRKGKK